MPAMEQVLNPLYNDAHSLVSPQRKVPKPLQKQQQQQQQERQQSSQQPASGRFRQWRKACFSCTPWLVVLGVAVLVAAQVVWAVHTDKFVAAAQQLLDRAAIQVPPELATVMYILKAVLIGVTSFLGGMLLLLGIAVKRQRLTKRAATTRADWPHGCKSHTTMSLSIALAMLLWLVAAGFVGLLCCTFSATGVALAGDVAAGQALSLASESPPTLQQLQASLKHARTAFSGAVQRAPPVIKRMPWFDDLTGSLQPLLSSQGSSNSTAQADDNACPATCLNLRLLTQLLHRSSGSSGGGCLCVKAALRQAQQLLRDMWLDGLVAFIALAVLAALATWMLIYCLVVCLITWRDHVEARHCKYLLQQVEQQDGTVSRWMWTAGVASPNSNSETMSSFPAFEHPLDVKRPPQLLAPELTASTLSPSPRKQGKSQQQQQDQDMLHGACHAQAEDDIERPPQMLPDQLPVQSVPVQHAPGNPQQLQLPAATPVSAVPVPADSGTRSAHPSTTGRRDAHRAAASNSGSMSTSSYRRRWQEGQNARS